MTDDNTGGTTGQVSVAELLARNGATVGTGGRRRRGMAGGISVAELTGEIPVIRDETPADEDGAPDETPVADEAVAADEAVVAEETPAAAEPEPETRTRRRPTPAFVPREEPALFSGAPSAAQDRLRESVERPETAEPDTAPETAPEPETTEPEKAPEPDAAAEPETTVLDRVEVDGRTDTETDTDTDTDTEAETDTLEAARPESSPSDETPAPASSRGPVRQWLSLLGQGVVAIVLGALLFKGFERLWEMLPWVALVLAFFVIVGLVAVVRVLRRTDDIVSILLAVVVGVFVTLGPLAFMLST
ncbi:Yip1 family protein [Rhodococcoides corynebacterioides]|uniref:Uncharacterized protein n=1 Tax=Rhodococcoides corynebacterioides TaxID=53972 RepID=A0ABS7P416_9NOCA|nr:Yip1 family protein [Rhodococcus corynebacterioides]MBY6367133.1 hypothetical protein [Rhodococcus corynebacterioides]MBY6407453.1 hypothetical protein [Rhodococcus corynebacterioides]